MEIHHFDFRFVGSQKFKIHSKIQCKWNHFLRMEFLKKKGTGRFELPSPHLILWYFLHLNYVPAEDKESQSTFNITFPLFGKTEDRRTINIKNYR